MNGTKIRDVVESELPRVSEILAINFRTKFGHFLSDEQTEYMITNICAVPKLKQNVEEGEHIVGLLLDDLIVGFAAFRFQEDEIFLHQLYVDPEYQGNRYGSSLLDYVISTAHENDIQRLKLTVNRANARAISMYKDDGFTIEDSVDFPIGHGYVMDDYVMVKQLDNQ